MQKILAHPLGAILIGPWAILVKIAFDGMSNSVDIVLLLFKTLARIPFLLKNPELTLKQAMSIGVSSLPLVFVTSLFTGMVAAVQAAYQFRNFVPDKFIGTAVCKMVIIELSPVLMGLVMSGRVGSALAAEIGSMKEKEELDAMSVLDLDPLRYLALPRLLSFMLMMPALSLFSMFLAIVGGWLVAVLALDITTYTYISGLRFQFVPLELYSGLVKSFVFGILIFLMGYHHGVNAGSGARGVGQATMKVVVSSCVLILIFDFIITLLMFH